MQIKSTILAHIQREWWQRYIQRPMHERYLIAQSLTFGAVQKELNKKWCCVDKHRIRSRGVILHLRATASWPNNDGGFDGK